MSVRGQYGPPFDTRTHSASETTIIGWPRLQPSRVLSARECRERGLLENQFARGVDENVLPAQTPKREATSASHTWPYVGDGEPPLWRGGRTYSFDTILLAWLR